MEKIKILIVDDEKLIREGLKLMISTFDDIEVVDTAENGYKALEICVADKVVEAVKAGAIKHFFLVAGCDGYKNERM